jgi:hypothetical protein
LKKSVPADWTTAARHAARPPPGRRRAGRLSDVCTSPPAVKRIEPMKKVTASASAPTSSAYPGNGPIRKHADPAPKSSPIQRSRLMRPSS